jgi:hypothetical protein
MSKFRDLSVDINDDNTLEISFYQYDKYYIYDGTTITTYDIDEEPREAFNGAIVYDRFIREDMRVDSIRMRYCLDEQTLVFELEPDYIDKQELINQIESQL